ncbi:Disease resistance protein [Corchorus olitorius]|uniref:Disease resistance protein n=1 Tax=Corchorus olitorius TaxID=93759 RepID=A0A1R3GV12_9ROSI|nr:Disease resistance protein [Corchorus olitorius]
MESSIADLLLGKIVSILENEVALLSGVRDEIKEIKLELTSMRSFLEDADKGVHGKTENVWISSVRDMVYEVEDINDEFTYHVNKQKQLGFFSKAIRYPGTLLLRHKVAVKLQDIIKRIKSIAERNQRYGGANRLGGADRNLGGISSNNDPNWLKNHSEASLFLKDDDLVGIDKAQEKLLGWLLDEEPRRTVVLVVGMGGLGKTTLVANTFKKQIVKQHFDCSAWITVSQQYGTNEILRSMVKEVYKKANEQTPENLSSMSFRDLVESLLKMLENRKYLIVFDDVWDIKFWHDINVALPTNMTRSRIVLTTRREDVASFEFGVVNYVLSLKPLTYEASWNLFCKKAFASMKAQCPQYLDFLARNLVAKCEGLPLAIVALGGLMASKNSIAEWDGICFVEATKDSTPEVVAQRYLMELICRGLLQVVERDEAGRPKVCKMHDILRELALSISKAEKFISEFDGKEVEESGIRRLSIETKEKEIKVCQGIRRLRSLFSFAGDDISQSSFNMLASGFKLLRVLDLEDTPILELPPELVYLFNLRYLNLTRTKVKELPESIWKLFNLQSLIAKETQIKELPQGIVKLKNLRHLIARAKIVSIIEFEIGSGIRVPSNICSLESLQVLSTVEARGNLIKQLSRMTQLTSLSIAKVKEGVMPGLEELYVTSCPEFMTLPHGWESELPDLKELYLRKVSSKIMQQFCAAADVDYESTIQATEASRVEVEESKLEWHYKFWL